MPRVELAPEIGDDIYRLLDLLHRYEMADAPTRIAEIIQGISVLERNPLIGQAVHDDMRMLTKGRQTKGNVALYRYFHEIDTILVLAIRSQRETGYQRP
jgi:plasmid stabilization system protein ParE